jgi:hypothetical protein
MSSLIDHLELLRTTSCLAEKTQVILFTHHSRFVEQSKLLKANIQVQEL